MKKCFAIIILFGVFNSFIIGQNPATLIFNKRYEKEKVIKGNDLVFTLNFEKGDLYDIAVKQNGIDVVVEISDKNKQKLADKDSPNGAWGYEKLEFSATETASYFLQIKRLDEAGNPDTGEVDVKIKHFTKKDLLEREKIKKELAPENSKTVLTADIDHFWQAWDNLKNCKTYEDSVQSFEKLYIERATDGLIDFIKVRDFNADEYVKLARKYPKFYNSIRENTYATKKAEPFIEEIFQKFKTIYPDFKAFKVCFAIGNLGTGGTTTDKFVLIGSEITTSTDKVDLSEIKNEAFRNVLAGKEDIVQKIKNMVAHECVHTQQKGKLDSTAINCPLLYTCMLEGACDFIGELLAGSQINTVAQSYGDAHEKELWATLKAELCSTNHKNWVYNMGEVKGKPGDLGYYMGYKISKAYYEKASEKKQAVTDIIDMKNPLQFLEKSGYDKQF